MFTWAHSINSRIRGEERAGQSLSLWREAIDNAETLLDVARKLAFVLKKADLFQKILRHFLGDVQMYAEVDDIRNAVNGVFRDALEDVGLVRKKIEVELDSNEIYIVAHSEGTVISWTSLRLAAMQAKPPEWLDEVKGFVTLGSPIDKHHLIWGENFPADISTEQPEKIKWWNFWDYSDPVGHSLDGIFGGDVKKTKGNKQFKRMFDDGYWRYPIPGKAHVDYWKDINLHHKIVQEVMGIPAGYKAGQMRVADRWWGRLRLTRRRTLPQFGDFVAYGLARGVEVVALLYFLSRLLSPIRERLVQRWPAWFEKAKAWPSPSGGTILHYLNMAIWTLGTAWVWKFVWDVCLGQWQDKKLNLERQLRRERVAMCLWAWS
jgi:hypothetical protein